MTSSARVTEVTEEEHVDGWDWEQELEEWDEERQELEQARAGGESDEEGVRWQDGNSSGGRVGEQSDITDEWLQQVAEEAERASAIEQAEGRPEGDGGSERSWGKWARTVLSGHIMGAGKAAASSDSCAVACSSKSPYGNSIPDSAARMSTIF